MKQLYAVYGDVIYGNIYRITNNRELSQEVLQNTFLKAWNNISLFDHNKGGLFTWLNSIARNSSLDQVRLKGYQNNQRTESLDSQVYEENKSFINNNKIDIEKLMSKLEDKNKIIIDRVYLQGYSHRDVAKDLNLPLGTVKSRLRIGIKILREEIKAEKKLFFGLLLVIILLLNVMLWL